MTVRVGEVGEGLAGGVLQPLTQRTSHPTQDQRANPW